MYSKYDRLWTIHRHFREILQTVFNKLNDEVSGKPETDALATSSIGKLGRTRDLWSVKEIPNYLNELN